MQIAFDAPCLHTLLMKVLMIVRGGPVAALLACCDAKAPRPIEGQAAPAGPCVVRAVGEGCVVAELDGRLAQTRRKPKATLQNG